MKVLKNRLKALMEFVAVSWLVNPKDNKKKEALGYS